MKRRILIILFFAVCLVPSVGLLLFGPAQAAANETLTSTPSLLSGDNQLNTGILDDITDWMTDRFALRQELVTLQRTLMAVVFHESGEEDVLLGTDGWLFYTETLDDYQVVNTMTDREIWAAARSLALIEEYCESKGVTFVFTVAPNKNTLYGDYMPARYAAGDQEEKNLFRLADALEAEGVNYVDLYAALSEQDEVLYRKQDSHWNTLGASLAGDTILTALGVDFDPFYGEESWTTVYEEVGDLYEMVYPTGTKLDEDQAYDRDFTFTYVQEPRSSEDNLIYTVNEGKSGSLLMFRDSFGNALHSFMAEAFGSACFSRLTPYDLTMLDTQNADTLVIELVERNLSDLNTSAAQFPAPEREVTADASVELAVTVHVTEPEEETEETALTGYVQLTGTLDAADLDDDSPIYIQVGETVYEATPAGDGDTPFTAWIPQDVLETAGAIEILVYQDDLLVCSQLIEIV